MKCQQWLVSAAEQITHSCGTYDRRSDNDLSRTDQNHHHHNNNNNIDRKPTTESTSNSSVIGREHRRGATAQMSGPGYDTVGDRMNCYSDLSGHLTDHSSGKSSTDEDMYGETSAMQSCGQSVAEKSRETMCSPIGMMAGSSGAMLKSTDAAEIEADKVLGKFLEVLCLGFYWFVVRNPHR